MKTPKINLNLSTKSTVIAGQYIFKAILWMQCIFPFLLALKFDAPVIVLLLAALGIPVLYVLFVGLTTYALKQVASGKHAFDSASFNSWLLRDFIHENIVTIPFFNNFVNRIFPIRSIFYRLVGMKLPKMLIVAPDVKLLDPDKIELGESVFIGHGAVLGPHIIRSGKLVLEPIKIGDDCIIGAFTVIGAGVTIGHKSKIDTFAILNSNVILGNKVTVLGRTLIEADCNIADKVKIGIGCRIGKNVTIGAGAKIGANCTIASGVIIPPDTVLPEMANVDQNWRFSTTELAVAA